MRSLCTLFPVQSLLRLALMAPLVAGCASEGDALEKRLAKLQEDVTRLQSETDRTVERLDAVELRQASVPRSDERVASAQTTTQSRPKLKVVRVEPEGNAEADEAMDSAPVDESGPRVVIQGEGKALESRTLAAAPRSTPKAEPTKKAEPVKAPQK